MRSVILAVLALISLVSADSVIELTDADFDSKLADIDTALVMFYAPWCGHCKRLKPEFEKSSGDLLANDPPVSLVKVDCTEGGKDTCGRFEVRGYPTLKIFRNGELSSDYNGPREAAGITKYMKSQVGPASKEIGSVAEAEAILGKTDAVIFGFGAADSTIQKNLAKTAAKLREEYTFAHTSEEEVMTKLGHKEGVVLFRPKHLQNKFEDSAVVYDGAADDKGALSKWIVENIHGLCGHRTTDNAKDFKMPLVVAYYNVDYAKNAKGTNYWRNRVLKVGKEFSGYNFAVSNKDDFMSELTEFGFDHSAGDKPVVTARDSKGLKYKMTAEFGMETFKDFLTQLEAGNIEPYIKSEPVPDNSAAGVKVAVAKNFEELVTKSEKDVLVEFYAPWCGHCKKLTPIYDELGEKMAEENVEIVKMDATANDVPPAYDVKGFPTLYWLPKGSKKPESYNGGRELDDFIKFISEKATDELKGYNRKGKEKKSEL
jgi:protein disulfide isomerase family A protein 3